tara:strand:+ start:918 stop:1349 length:432 start_codon:yes stop_codon:yes gene_type:complete
MKQLREYIKKEIKRLNEANIVKRPLPNDVKQTLFGLLQMKPTHINKIQAIKSIKPSYKITINNGQTFIVSDIGDNFGFGLVNINGKEYDILDTKQQALALTALNDLQTKPIFNPLGGEGGENEETPSDETETPTEEPEEEPET